MLRIGWAVNGLGCHVSNQGPSQLMMHHISTAAATTEGRNRTGNGGGWPHGGWTNGGGDLEAGLALCRVSFSFFHLSIP